MTSGCPADAHLRANPPEKAFRAPRAPRAAGLPAVMNHPMREIRPLGGRQEIREILLDPVRIGCTAQSHAACEAADVIDKSDFQEADSILRASRFKLDTVPSISSKLASKAMPRSRGFHTSHSPNPHRLRHASRNGRSKAQRCRFSR